MGSRSWLIFMTGLLAVLATWVVSETFLRNYWFDEALTLLEFASLENVHRIYSSYAIPNNHIVFNICLRLFTDTQALILPITDVSLRFFPALLGLSAPLLLFFAWRKRLGEPASFLTALCFCLSLPYEINSSALRGYMLSFLLVLAGFELARHWLENKKPLFLALYFLAALLGIGTIPSNLLPFLALGAYFFPECGYKPFDKRFIALILLPVLGFLIFYIPIFGKLLHAVSLREGWNDGLSAAVCTYAAFGFAALGLLPFATYSLLQRWKESERAPRLRMAWRGIVLLAPLPAFLLLPVSPFPRNFFPFWPLWLFLLGLLLREFFLRLDTRGEKYLRGFFVLCILFCAAAAALLRAERKDLGDFFVKEGRLDDFFSPYYSRADYKPMLIANYLSELKKELKQEPEVFVSFKADPYPFVFYGKFRELPETIWKYDSPRGKVQSFGKNGPAFLILHGEGELEAALMRFNLNKDRVSLLEDAGYQRLYQVSD